MGTERQDGFSLLEVLVAFAILAVALGVLLRIFGGGARLGAQAEARGRAVLLAESLLAAVGREVPLEAGERSGPIDDTYRYRLSITPWQPPEISTEHLPAQPYWVELSVIWGDETHPREFTLSTLRLKARAAPLTQPGFGGLP